MNRTRITLFATVLGGCTVDDNSNPFGAGTAPAPTTTIAMTTMATGDSSSDGTVGTDESETTASSLSASTSTTTGETTGIDPSGTAGDAASSDGGTDGGNGMQPNDGMYSHCLTPEECGFSPVLCITIQDAMMNPTDGFCSETGCLNAAMDCDPSPGGTATSICMPTTIDGMMAQACALDCSAGKICPVPMQCYNLTDVGMVCG